MLRAWVPGCSTGEEAYSLAIALFEVLNELQPASSVSVQVFASDLDRDAVEVARQAIYPTNIAADVSPERLKQLAVQAARGTTTLPVQASVNVADDLASGDVFLTVSGTSAEAGDDGETGRGNRVSGLITPYRAMTIEAAAGKNPVSHVGKLYNLAAMRIAAAIAAEVPGVADASCILVSQIGRPIHDPQVVDIGLIGSTARNSPEQPVTDIVNAVLQQLPAMRDELLAERLPVY